MPWEVATLLSSNRAHLPHPLLTPATRPMPTDLYGPSHAPTDFCESCGRAFASYQYLVVHRRTCRPAKREISSLLDETKVFWESRKRRKITDDNRGQADVGKASCSQSVEFAIGYILQLALISASQGSRNQHGLVRGGSSTQAVARRVERLTRVEKESVSSFGAVYRSQPYLFAAGNTPADGYR